jgi:hypothetical protein
MSARAALAAALRDFYAQSWRLLAVNAALGIAGAAVLYAAIVARPAALAVVLLGPVVAALAHCAVKLAQTEDLQLGDALEGLRLHWRREPEAPLRDAASRAFELLLRRPRPVLGLGVALLLVNVAGVVAALMPFLTLTVAYSFLAAAHFVFPREASH